MIPRREYRHRSWVGRSWREPAERTWREGLVGNHFTWLHARAGDEKRG